MYSIDRLRGLLAANGTLLVVVLAVLGASALGGAVFMVFNPPTETVTQETNAETVAFSTNVSAVVTEETPLYAQGQELQGLPVYFLSASPNMTLSVTTTVPADQPVTVARRLVIYMEAERSGDRFWNERRVLAADEQTVRDGSAELTTTVNMSEVRSEMARRQAAIGEVGSFTSEVRLTITYETERYSEQFTASSPLVFSENAYWIGTPLEGSRTYRETVSRQVARPPDMVTVGGLSLVGILLLFGAVAIRWYDQSDPEPERLPTDVVHERFEEWISVGEFPTGTEKKFVHIESLKDLVDIAIDSNKRVVFDAEFSAYAVIDGDLIYYYSKNRERIEGWLDV